MQKSHSNHIKNLLLPCLAFSLLVGVFSTIFVTVFKLVAEIVIHYSSELYAAVRANPLWLPLLLLGAAAIGLVASLILSASHSCRGGGIPTSVAAIHGIIHFKWLASAFLVPLSALLSFFCGIPLGTEGPCVQMGTAIGDGVVHCFGGEKHKGWRRYMMTGGAAAGFSLATASPITAILFSIEELHKRISPILLSVASLSVIFAQLTAKFFSFFGFSSGALFSLTEIAPLAPKLLFAPLLVGLVCGGASILFSYAYQWIDHLMHSLLKKISVKIALPVIFATIALIGFFLVDTLGNGHSLTERLFRTSFSWYLLLLLFLIRAAAMMISNTAGATGGVFLPTLAFGAMLGALCAEGMLALGWIEADHYLLMVVLGVTSFLGATSRIPVTACVFAVEALGGINNILALIIASSVSFFVVELSGVEDFTDTVIEAKVRAINKGKEKIVFEVPLTVQADSFAVGKELRDILWPSSGVVVSFDRAQKGAHHSLICEGDVITVHYRTHSPTAATKNFEFLVGPQSEEIRRMMLPTDLS